MMENRNEKYGYKVLAKGVKQSMNTWATGMNNNVCCIAGSGHGKTTGFVAPNIEAAKNSLVIADTKGQLSRRYTQQLKNRGYQVYTINLSDPEKSCGYNPLRYIRRHRDGSVYEQDIMTVANIIQGKGSDKEPYWDQASADYLCFLISYTIESDLPWEEKNLITVAQLHQAFLQPNGNAAFSEWMEKHKNSFTAKKFAQIASLRNTEKTFGCVMSFAGIALACMEYKEAMYLLNNPENEIDLERIGSEKTVVFVETSDVDFTFNKLATLLYSQLFQVLTKAADERSEGTLEVPVDIYLDDFVSSAAAIPWFDRIISVIRSRDISVNLMLQSLNQLEEMYGKHAAQTIVDNCDTILYMGCNSPETARFIGERASKTPENILCGLPREKLWLISSGKKAVLADKILPYSGCKKTGGILEYKENYEPTLC